MARRSRDGGAGFSASQCSKFSPVSPDPSALRAPPRFGEALGFFFRPRKGEGDRAKRGGGARCGWVLRRGSVPSSTRPLGRFAPPPRSGDEFVSDDPKPRNKHRTLGASNKTVRMARKLRREMSLPETLLWRQLQEHPGGYRFRKQHPIGAYSLDFACIRARLAIEVDGEAHERGDRPVRDEVRDAWVLKQGFHMLRLPAVEVLKNMEGVIIAIVEACRARAKPSPPRNGEVARRVGGAGSDARRPMLDGPVPTTPPQQGRGPPPRSGEELS